MKLAPPFGQLAYHRPEELLLSALTFSNERKLKNEK
jgi:hypothetical protein